MPRSWSGALPEDEEEIVSYLSSGVCKGVGPATARRIVDRFGTDTLDILEREPERLTALKGVTAKKAQEIAESFRRHMGLRRLMAFLPSTSCRPSSPWSCGASTATRPWRRCGEPLPPLRREPAAWPFPSRTGWPWAWALSAESQQRLQAAVTYELLHNENNGHVFLPRKQADRRHRPSCWTVGAIWWSRPWTGSDRPAGR